MPSALSASRPLRIVLAVSRYPWPARSGDQRRTDELVTALAELGEVVVLTPEPPAGAPRPPAGWPGRLVLYRRPARWSLPVRAVAAVLGGAPLEWAWLGGGDLLQGFRQEVAGADLAILQLSRLVSLLDAVPPDSSLAVDLVDSLALNLERRAAAGSALLAPVLGLAAARHRRAEERLLERAGVGLVVAEGDRMALAARLPSGLAARLRVVPLVAPGTVAAARPPANGSPILIVTGNLGYFPTHHGVMGFLRDTWPGLRAARGDLEVRLVGARPRRELRRAAARAGATVIADPALLPPFLAAATIALAPLEAGTGQPIKVLEAWAAGVPVVASPRAAAGVGGRDGVDLRIASTPPEWQRAILDLVDRPAEGARLAAAGRARLAADFSRVAVAAALRQALAPVLSARKPSSRP